MHTKVKPSKIRILKKQFIIIYFTKHFISTVGVWWLPCKTSSFLQFLFRGALSLMKFPARSSRRRWNDAARLVSVSKISSANIVLFHGLSKLSVLVRYLRFDVEKILVSFFGLLNWIWVEYKLAIQSVFDGDFVVTPRMRLKCVVSDTHQSFFGTRLFFSRRIFLYQIVEEYHITNDLAIHRGMESMLIRHLDCYVNGIFMTSGNGSFANAAAAYLAFPSSSDGWWNYHLHTDWFIRI